MMPKKWMFFTSFLLLTTTAMASSSLTNNNDFDEDSCLTQTNLQYNVREQEFYEKSYIKTFLHCFDSHPIESSFLLRQHLQEINKVKLTKEFNEFLKNTAENILMSSFNNEIYNRQLSSINAFYENTETNDQYSQQLKSFLASERDVKEVHIFVASLFFKLKYSNDSNTPDQIKDLLATVRKDIFNPSYKKIALFYIDNLGNYLNNETGQQQAILCYEFCAEHNHLNSHFQLGMIYYGRGRAFGNFAKFNMFLTGSEFNIENNLKKAEHHLKQAADLGSSDAQYMIGNIFEKQGKFSEAKNYFKLAADQGHALSQCAIERMLYDEQKSIDFNEKTNDSTLNQEESNNKIDLKTIEKIISNLNF